MRRFYLHLRNSIYYAVLVDPETGYRAPARSTGATNRDDACIIVSDWLKNGIPTPQKEKPKDVAESLAVGECIAALKKVSLAPESVKKLAEYLVERGALSSFVLAGSSGAEPFETFITRFWTYETSPHVTEKKAGGGRIGKTHTRLSLQRARLYWVPYFKGKTIGQISPDDVKAFSLYLAHEFPKLSPLTCKRIMDVGTTALKWAAANGMAQKGCKDCGDASITFSTTQRDRGILTPEEAKRLFSMSWDDKRAMLINLTAMTTGLRIGEILALKAADVGDVFLFVSHSYSRSDGLKCTKTGKARQVPIMPQVRDALRELAKENPYRNKEENPEIPFEGFIFYGCHEDKPWDQQMPLYALQDMLIRMKAGEGATEAEREVARAYWRGRNIVFHSWRHFYSKMMSDRVEAEKVMLATGHSTRRVFDNYADHVFEADLAEVAEVGAKVFAGFLPAQQAG